MVQRYVGQGETPLVAAHWAKASRVWVPSRTGGVYGLDDSTNRLLCRAWEVLRGRESSRR